MRQAVQLVEHPEERPLGARRAAGEDDRSPSPAPSAATSRGTSSAASSPSASMTTTARPGRVAWMYASPIARARWCPAFRPRWSTVTDAIARSPAPSRRLRSGGTVDPSSASTTSAESPAPAKAASRPREEGRDQGPVVVDRHEDDEGGRSRRRGDDRLAPDPELERLHLEERHEPLLDVPRQRRREHPALAAEGADRRGRGGEALDDALPAGRPRGGASRPSR